MVRLTPLKMNQLPILVIIFEPLLLLLGRELTGCLVLRPQPLLNKFNAKYSQVLSSRVALTVRWQGIKCHSMCAFITRPPTSPCWRKPINCRPFPFRSVTTTILLHQSGGLFPLFQVISFTLILVQTLLGSGVQMSGFRTVRVLSGGSLNILVAHVNRNQMPIIWKGCVLLPVGIYVLRNRKTDRWIGAPQTAGADRQMTVRMYWIEAYDDDEDDDGISGGGGWVDVA